MKHISLLGSTGSIGTQTLDVVRAFPNEFTVVCLAANSNIELLKEQISEFKPQAVAVFSKELADSLSDFLSHSLTEGENVEVYSGVEGLQKLASFDSCDMVVNALVGSIGVLPTLSAIDAEKDIALANKETLVAAGDIVMKRVKDKGVTLIPIDSEHSAIFQCLRGEDASHVRKLIITCSGGPFFGKSSSELHAVTVSDALNHPTWSMGSKITIDSATLMNKGLEVIEAHHLYGVPYEDIDVLIHPQSIIHSMVEFSDRSVVAQKSVPSMKIPIQYALTHPQRLHNDSFPTLDLAEVGQLTFSRPDMSSFSCLSYAYEAGREGGTMPCVMNAANEVLVEAFLNGQCGFMDIPRVVKSVMDAHDTRGCADVDDVLCAEKWAREKTFATLSESQVGDQ